MKEPFCEDRHPARQIRRHRERLDDLEPADRKTRNNLGQKMQGPVSLSKLHQQELRPEIGKGFSRVTTSVFSMYRIRRKFKMGKLPYRALAYRCILTFRRAQRATTFSSESTLLSEGNGSETLIDKVHTWFLHLGRVFIHTDTTQPSLLPWIRMSNIIGSRGKTSHSRLNRYFTQEILACIWNDHLLEL